MENPTAQTINERIEPSGPLSRFWMGLYPLLVTFWIFYVCVPNVLELLYIGAILAWQRPLPVPWAIILFVYWVVASVAVWRSAGAYLLSPMLIKRLWAWLARGVVVFVAFVAIMYNPNGGEVLAIVAKFLVIYTAQVIRGG
jgi:hypothetical protein